MRTSLPLPLLALTLLPMTLEAAADQRSWLDNTIATCLQVYDEASCNDPEFLEEHYHVRTLQIAHKASQRGRLEERRALRELSLQRLCGKKTSDFCDDGDALCAQQMTQMCDDLDRRADQCQAYAKDYCADSSERDCSAQLTAYCPSAKKQDIDVLLAKYPKLSAEQKTRLAQVADALDRKNRGLIGNLFHWLGF